MKPIIFAALLSAATSAHGALPPDHPSHTRGPISLTAVVCALSITYPAVEWYQIGPARMLGREHMSRFATDIVGILRVAILCSPVLFLPAK